MEKTSINEFYTALENVPEIACALIAADKVSENMGLTEEQHQALRNVFLVRAMKDSEECARIFYQRMTA